MGKFWILLLITVQLLFANGEADHQKLRGLLQNIQQAVNTKKYADLKPYFSPNMKVTTINQETLSSPEQIEAYFNKWFGKGGYLKDVKMKLYADNKTEFYGDNIGVVWGHGDEKYLLSDTRFFDMKTRWTATVIKGDDGKWRILTLHIGTNFLDNPVINGVKESIKMFLGIGFLVGLILGLLISFLYFRKKYRNK